MALLLEKNNMAKPGEGMKLTPRQILARFRVLSKIQTADDKRMSNAMRWANSDDKQFKEYMK